MHPTPLTTTMVKRVKKEMERDELFGQLLDNTFLYLPIKLHPSLQKRAEAKGVDPALIFTLSEYPWRAPEVHFCSMHLDKIYSCTNSTTNIFKEIQLMDPSIKCLRCSSFLCGENWHAARKIRDIVNEFKKITSLKARAVERVVCNKIQEELFRNLTNVNGKPNQTVLPLRDIRISEFL